MKRFMLPALCVFLAISSASTESLTWRTGSVEDALAAAKAEGKLLLIDFFTETG